MKKYNMFQPYYMSFYSRPLYQDVGHNWRGIGFFYLLVLLFLAWMPTMLILQSEIRYFADQRIPPIVKQIPDISFEDGVTKIDAPSPVFITDPKTNATIAILDTSGKYTSLDETKAAILLTKDRLYVRSNNGNKHYNVLSFVDYRVNQQEIFSILQSVKNWALSFLYPIFLIVSMIYRLLLALIFAAIGYFIFESQLKTLLNFKSIYRLAMIAMTPAIIIATVIDLIAHRFNYQDLSGYWIMIVYALISLSYLYFAMSSNSTVQTAPAKIVE